MIQKSKTESLNSQKAGLIEFLYFEGCPNAAETLSNLKKVLKELKINDDKLKIIEVRDIEMAKNLNFSGSPTILVDGKDIYTLKKPEGFNFTCRVYDFGGKKSGIIPEDFIKERLIELGVS